MKTLIKEQGLVVGVVSNADGRVESYLKGAGLWELFDFVLDSHLVGVEKPDPRIFEMALAKARVAARESLYVGDLYQVDVVGARSAGLFPVLMDPLMADEYQDVARVRNVEDLARRILVD